MTLRDMRLIAEGYGKEGSAGHISIRDPVMPDHFW